MKLTKGKIVGLLCAGFGALLGAILDDFGRQAEIKEAVKEYMASREQEREEDKEKEV